MGDDLQIGPLLGGVEVGARSAGAAPAAAGLLAPSYRVPGAGRQVVDVGAILDPELLRRVDDRLTGGGVLAHRRGRQVTAFAMNFSVFSGPVLSLLEVRQHIVPAPAAIAELRPMIEILRLAADVAKAVDRRRTAEHPAARIDDRAAGGAGVGLRLEAPG